MVAHGLDPERSVAGVMVRHRYLKAGLGALTVLALLSPGPAGAQEADVGGFVRPFDELLGQTVPPVLNQTYGALGQNVTREDVRMTLDLNISKADVNFFGLLIGSGRGEVQAKIHASVEMRVISAERIRAALEGENAYNVSAENATFLSEVYLPADAFRASLSAEMIAAFQRDQEAALARLLAESVPELDVLALRVAWQNVAPQQVFDDDSVTEPPIVVTLDLVVQYIRIESLRSLLEGYFASSSKKEETESPKEAYVEKIKKENGTALKSRDFFAAAAYTQLLNLSLQPGWSLDVALQLPRGYSFTYFNDAVEARGERGALFHLDASNSDDDVHKVFLASLTHRRAVALALFLAVMVVGLLVRLPVGAVYARFRLRPTPSTHVAPHPTPGTGQRTVVIRKGPRLFRSWRKP
jgi:hypothetical protein